MTVAELKGNLQEKPFRPFKIISADGHEIEVPHKDYVNISPTGPTAVVWKPDGGVSIVDILLATRLEFEKPQG